MVSVIIPNYNHALFLRKRIESVLLQSYPDFEIILLDDCSTDNSREIIEQYRAHPRVTHIVYNTTNSGSPFRQWQKGLTLAKGDWVWIAESDDYCKPDFLSVLLGESVPAACGVRYCVSESVDDNDQAISAGNSLMPKPVMDGVAFLKKHLLQNNVIPNASSVLVRSNLLPDSLFHSIQSIRLVGDWFIWCALCLKTNVFFSADTRNYHRSHAQTVRARSIGQGEYYLEFSAFRQLVGNQIGQADIAKKCKDELLELNTAFFFENEGMRGIELLRNKKYKHALLLILKASLKPRITVYYIRSALYWLLKS